MNIGRSEYTRLVRQEIRGKKATSLLIRLKSFYEEFLITVEDEWGEGRSLSELKENSLSEEVKILLEIDEFLKE
jgi:hypothetical protein